MALETELKLAITARDVPLLLAHPLLAAAPLRRQKLLSTYFDTPKRALLARRVAVRQRRVGRQTLLTVKTAGTVIGGLTRRGEWEAPAVPGSFDFVALVDDSALADELQALAVTLVPVFTTDFTRRSWQLSHRKAQIEVSLDRGRITSVTADGPRSQPLLELELELKDGPADALFSLVRKLGQAARLHPVTASKAERGYALFQGRKTKPVKAVPLMLQPGQYPVDAFRTVALACLTHLQANEAGVLTSDDIEFLHQARIAIRRLRAALRVFTSALPGKFVARWSLAWKALAKSLGAARDHDVFRTALLPDLAGLLGPREATRLRAWARKEGAAATAAARDSLSCRDYSDHLLAFTRAVLRLKGGESASHAQPLPRWSRQRLRQRHRKLLRQIRTADLLDPIERHRVRIEAKKLRYALDFLAGLWPPEQLTACAGALAQAQDLLGTMNDLVTAQSLLAAAPKGGAEKLQEALGRHLVESAGHLPAVLRTLKQAPVPWK